MKLKTRNWMLLFASNFMGVLNDNFLKHAIIFCGITWLIPSWISQSQLIGMISGALVFPYLIFSPLSGFLAVKYAKKKMFLWAKILELPIMLLACTAFYYQKIFLALLAVLLMGIQSCLYSPSKYGLIRDIGGEEGAAFGSGCFEAMAFLGILIGTILASILSDYQSTGMILFGFIFFAIVGLLFTALLKVKERPVEKNQAMILNPIRFIKESWQYAKSYHGLNIAVFGVSMFWMIGGMIQMNLVIHGSQTLHLTNTQTGLMMAVAAIGIASGCFVAGKLSRYWSQKTMIYLGLSVMIFSMIIIALFNPAFYNCCFLIFLTAFFGGCFVVPCLTIVQTADVGRKLGDMIAYMNLMLFIFVFLGTLLFSIITKLTNENSLAVFAFISGLAGVTILVFVIAFKSKKTR